MVGYDGEPLVRYREVFDRRLQLASWVAEFCRSAHLHLRVVGKDLDSARERGFYRDLLGPEGLLFIPAGASPNGRPMLVACNEVSGTTTLWEVTVPARTVPRP